MMEDALKRVRAGDSEAFREIVAATSERLVRVAARLMGSKSEGEDVVQDAYLKAYQALSEDRFDGRASVPTWLYRIVVNTATDALRRRGRKERRAADQVGPASWDGERAAEAHLALQELDQWLKTLAPEQRIALVLKNIEGLTSREIAEMMNCTEGAVEQRLVRARATLRRHEEEHDDE